MSDYHASGVPAMDRIPQRVLELEYAMVKLRFWDLWDYGPSDRVANGEGGCCAYLSNVEHRSDENGSP
jgi:hypothetical protein